MANAAQRVASALEARGELKPNKIETAGARRYSLGQLVVTRLTEVSLGTAYSATAAQCQLSPNKLDHFATRSGALLLVSLVRALCSHFNKFALLVGFQI